MTDFVTCTRCDARFKRPEYHALHLGRVHADVLDTSERARFEEAFAAEEAWLTEFRRHVRGGMAVLPAVVIYLVILLTASVGNANLLWTLLLLPGGVAFAGLLYAYEYSREPRGKEAEAGLQPK